jgi:hypothetical protein
VTKSILGFILLASFISNVFSEQRFTISGTVRDAETRETLTGVNVMVIPKGTGTITDIDGNYTLQLNSGDYRLVFSFIGYEPAERKIQLNRDLRLNIEMKNGRLRLSEVVVSAERSNHNIERAEMSTVTLNIETIRNTPAFLGEVDVLRTIQLLPGVQSAGDGNTGFFVRGGNSDQNLVLLDDAIVFNASHLFNFFSVFNPDAVKDITLYKGGIPPAYGGRLSSVLDVQMKDGNKNEFKINGGIGLISSRLTIEGPMQTGRSSFLLSGRRTYADLFLKLSSDEAQRETQLFFYDLNGKMNYVFNKRNRIFLSGYYGSDVTRFGDFFSFDWGNRTSSLRWNHVFSERFFSNISLLYSSYNFNITGDVGPANFIWQSYLNDIGIRADFNYISQQENTWTFGLQSIHHNLDPGFIEASIEGAASATFDLSATNAFEHGIYANGEYHFWDERLLVLLGARSSFFQVTGPGVQYEFDKSNPLQWQVADTIKLERGKIYNTFYGFEPRLSLRFKFTDANSLKGSYNRMVQYIQQAQSAQSVAPYDVWYSVSNNIPPQVADQIALGYFHNFMTDQIETSVEIYYKDMKNVSDIIDNGDILGNELLEGQIRIGKGWSYGAEFLIKKENDKFNGFIGYTWAITKRKIEDINEGRPYFAPNDRRNDISLSGGYNLTPRINLGVNFTYATGRAFTLPVGKMYYQGAFAPIYSDRNSGRLPDYHRLDLSITYKPRIKSENQRRIKSSWNFSLFNVYGRVNPISVSFAEKADQPGIPNSSFFYIPGPIPAITWNFEF